MKILFLQIFSRSPTGCDIKDIVFVSVGHALDFSLRSFKEQEGELDVLAIATNKSRLS